MSSRKSPEIAISLTPGFNPVSVNCEIHSATSAAFRASETVQTVSHKSVAAGTKLKPGVNEKSSRTISIALAALAAVLLLLALKFPLWKMHLEAPQYRDEEALNISVYPNSFHGDLRELNVLDQYIGVHIPRTLPQFKWLPAMLIAGATLTVLTAFLPKSIRSRTSTLLSVAMIAALLAAAVQARVQMHDIGHQRDQKTILVGVGDFTPPFLGTNKIAQFTVSSRFGLGAWLIGGAFALQLGAAWLGRLRVREAHLSLAPGFSTVEAANESCSAASAALLLPKTVETVSTFQRNDTGLKPGINESAALS